MKKIKYKIFFIVFFFYIQKWLINVITNTKEDSEKKHVKVIKIFLMKRNKKGEKRLKRDNKILLKRTKKWGSVWSERYAEAKWL